MGYEIWHDECIVFEVLDGDQGRYTGLRQVREGDFGQSALCLRPSGRRLHLEVIFASSRNLKQLPIHSSLKRIFIVFCKAYLAALVSGLAIMAGSAQASVIAYSGYDEAATAPGANTLAAQSAFVSATGSLGVIDFESPVSAGVTITGGTVLSTPPGSVQYWGSNTTAGGTHYLDFAQTVTFTFTTAIDSFGLIMGGLQGPNYIRWTNSSGAQEISVADFGGNGGFSFLGFTDFGQSITSVQISSPGDYDGADDIRFGIANAKALPEPTSGALLGLALIGLVANRRRMLSKKL